MRSFIVMLVLAFTLMGMAGAEYVYPQGTNASPTRFTNLTVDNYLTIGGSFLGAGIDNLIDTEYGLHNASNKIRVNLTTNDGLEFGSGAAEGSLGLKTGTGLDTGATGATVDTTDIVDNAHGISETDTNKAGVNLSSSSGLEFGTGSATGALKIDPSDASLTLAAGGISVRSSMIKRTLAAGTAAATNVTVSGMTVGDELISVVSYTTATSIASMADRTSDYAVATGYLYKAAGTNESGNQLDIFWLDRTA